MSEESLFSVTIKELIEAAKNDGVVTPEENDIIEQVKVDADSYNTILAESLSDGMITADEAEKLKELKQMILDRAELIAKIDGKFDDDEKVLIKKLTEIITKHYANHF